MKLESIIILGIIFANLYEFTRELLIAIGIVKTYHPMDISGILFSLFIILSIGVTIKHRYWIIACAFLLLNAIVKISALKSPAIVDSIIINKTETSIFLVLVMILSMFCLVLSSYYFYKLLRLKDFSFKKYNRIEDFNTSFKEKLKLIRKGKT